jgi:hypothetical protein
MRRLASLFVFAVIVAPAAAAAQSGEQGSVCVHDYTPGLICDSPDVAVEALVLSNVVEDCGVDATAQVVLDVVLSSDVLNRYDPGIFLSLNGGSALSGALCYHDYLAPPISTSPTYGDSYPNGVPDIRNGPWVDLEPFAQPEDTCGDLQGGTEVIKSLKSVSSPLQIPCTDTDQDGTVDVSVCASWENGSQQHSCRVVSDAVAENNSRCGCARVEVLPEPGAALALVCGAALLAALGRPGVVRRSV